MIEIRKEIQSDHDDVRAINDRAFGQSIEGEIVENIRDACNEIVSLVALNDGEIVGHILFSPVVVENGEKEIKAMGLGPMAVSPRFQKQGIGTLLVNEGIKILKKSKYHFIIVLGHSGYYPRFGFEKASKYGLIPQWSGIPDEAFMVLCLDASRMQHLAGVVHYRDEFNRALNASEPRP